MSLFTSPFFPLSIFLTEEFDKFYPKTIIHFIKFKLASDQSSVHSINLISSTFSMLIFVLLVISNCVSCCFYITNDNICREGYEKVQIHKFNKWDIFMRDIEKADNVNFDFADSYDKDHPFFESLRLKFGCTFTLTGLNKNTRIKFDALSSFHFAYDITLTNIIIIINKPELSANVIRLKNTKFIPETGISISVDTFSSDSESLASIEKLQATNFEIFYQLMSYSSKIKIEPRSASSFVDIHIMDVTGDISFGTQFQGFSILFENDKELQLNAFHCYVNMIIDMITPNATLKLWQYFISQAFFDSKVSFFLNEPTYIISDYFPSNTFDKNATNTQHVQYYIDASNDIYFTSNSIANLIIFDLRNSNANLTFREGSFLQKLIALDSNITINDASSRHSVIILESELMFSSLNSCQNEIEFIEKCQFANSKLFGRYKFRKSILYSGSDLYIQNASINKNSPIIFLAFPSNRTLQIDNFFDGTENYLDFAVQSGSDYYSNLICSKQKDFIKYKTINFSDADSIKVYDILYHESEQKGNYCIDLKRSDKNQYKENLKICIPTNKNNCPEGYIRRTKFANSFANMSSKVEICILTNTTKTLDLSDCHKDVSIKWLYSNSSQLNLTIIGTYFDTLSLIGINARFKNDIFCETVILQNSNVVSNYVFQGKYIKFDESSSFNDSKYSTENYELLDYNPEIITFENDKIIIDDMIFIKNQTITIDNDLPWNTEINLNSQSPGNVNLINTNHLSVLKIDSTKPFSMAKINIDPCGVVVFRNISGKVPINFRISSDTQFIIPEIFNVEFDEIKISNSLNFIPFHDIKVPFVEMSGSGNIVSGSLKTDQIFLSSFNYTNVGNISSSNINFSRKAFVKLTYSPEGKGTVVINFNLASVPYIDMNFQRSKKGQIIFVLDVRNNISISRDIINFEVPVINIANSSCRSWKKKNEYFEKLNFSIDTKCRMDGNLTVFYIVKRHNLESWVKVVIIISAIILFVLIIFGSMRLYAKLKRRYELQYLNKLYEHSVDASFPEISEDIDY